MSDTQNPKQNDLFKLVCNTPPALFGNFPKPAYHYNTKEQKEYFILTPHTNNSRNVHKYDIINNEYSILCPYPDGFYPNCHGQFIKPNTTKLYLFGGFGDKPAIGILDLDTLKWTVIPGNSGFKEGLFHIIDSVSIKSAEQQTILCADAEPSKVYRFDDKNDNFVLQHKFSQKIHGNSNAHLLSLDYCGKLVLFHATRSGECLSCDGNSEQLKEWNHFCNLPIKAEDEENERIKFGVITVFEGRVIIALQHDHTFWDDYDNDKTATNYIWCYDVEDKLWINTNIENQWKFGLVQLVKYKNILHIINCRDRYHFTIDLFDVIPESLMKKYSGRYQILVYGYIRIKENMESNKIPNDIISLISQFVVQL